MQLWFTYALGAVLSALLLWFTLGCEMPASGAAPIKDCVLTTMAAVPEATFMSVLGPVANSCLQEHGKAPLPQARPAPAPPPPPPPKPEAPKP